MINYFANIIYLWSGFNSTIEIDNLIYFYEGSEASVVGNTLTGTNINVTILVLITIGLSSFNAINIAANAFITLRITGINCFARFGDYDWQFGIQWMYITVFNIITEFS